MASRKTKLLTGPAAFIVGFILLVAVVLGAIVFWPKTDYSYNGYPIEKSNCQGTERTCYYTSLHLRDTDYTISFYHHPTEVESIGVAPHAIKTVYDFQTVLDGQITIGVPKNAPGSVGIAATEVSRVLGTRYNIFNFPVKAAVVGEADGEVSCADATPTNVVILFRQQEFDAVTVDSKNCIAIGATSEERAAAVADAFVYRLLNVIQYNETTNNTP